MNAKVKESLQKIKTVWLGRSMKQKALIIGGAAALVAVVAAIIIYSGQVKYVPLYTGQTVESIAQIKAVLDEKGVQYEIPSGGTSINVPEEQATTLLVDLAGQGYPKTGGIDASFFANSSGFSTTDNEFEMLKISAYETSLKKLIEGINGVENALVKITLPKDTLFASDAGQEATASVLLTVATGKTFDQSQINAMYLLISKAIPNLPTANIEIIDQYAQYYDLKSEDEVDSTQVVANQMTIKKEIERDIQRQVQQMLGTMMGKDKVLATVTTDIDFKQENREENIVLPVDEENIQGIALSAERIAENYTGGAANGGPPATQTAGDVPGVDYQVSNNTNDNGTYENTEERINYDVTRIRKQITEAPYKIRDLGIQVVIEPPDPENLDSIGETTVADVTNILGTIIRTSIAKDTIDNEMTDEQLASKISVSVQKFNGKQVAELGFFEKLGISPALGIGILIVLLLVIGALVFMLIRNRKKQKEEAYIIEELSTAGEDGENPDDIHLADPESSTSKKYLDKLAEERPAEFAKLIRTWMVDDK